MIKVMTKARMAIGQASLREKIKGKSEKLILLKVISLKVNRGRSLWGFGKKLIDKSVERINFRALISSIGASYF